MAWWVWLIAALVLGMASAFCAMLSLSAGTAYATDYHNLSPRQRVMARALALAALVAAIACGLAGAGLAAWAVKLLLV
jgi:predicted kinase